MVKLQWPDALAFPGPWQSYLSSWVLALKSVKNID